MTTVPAVIRMALHQQPAESDREERQEERRETEWMEEGGIHQYSGFIK